MNREKIERHITHLQEQHDELGRQIDEEFKRYGDDSIVTYLKKRKLQIRDEIQRCESQLQSAA